MCRTAKAMLLLAVVICMSAAQREKPQSCLCQGAKNTNVPKSDIKNVTIYPATAFCNKLEIIVSTKSGSNVCLNLKPDAERRLLKNLTRKIQSSKAPAAVSTSPTPIHTKTSKEA
ncbi:C-X-C motif chemokine 11-1-like [Nerophis lumbriciformis]|uniref:C-X-C motif chemokine 11-1-like n=1 Tax=Nerophis lumbriciformis TaxID=546530 RepID=UPI002AE0276A|nr:C-X-C motif chemokine 11-like [Nerophis lumbriciformis]